MNTIKVLHSSTPGARPAGRTVGELFLNLADGVFGYIDAAGDPIDYSSGGTSVTVADTAPASPSTGDLWFDSGTVGRAFVWDDAWIDLSPGGGGLGDGAGAGEAIIPAPGVGLSQTITIADPADTGLNVVPAAGQTAPIFQAGDAVIDPTNPTGANTLLTTGVADARYLVISAALSVAFADVTADPAPGAPLVGDAVQHAGPAGSADASYAVGGVVLTGDQLVWGGGAWALQRSSYLPIEGGTLLNDQAITLTLRAAGAQTADLLRVQLDDEEIPLSIDAAGVLRAALAESEIQVVTGELRQVHDDAVVDSGVWAAIADDAGHYSLTPRTDAGAAQAGGLYFGRGATGVATAAIEISDGAGDVWAAALDWTTASDLPAEDSLVTRARGDARWLTQAAADAAYLTEAAADALYVPLTGAPVFTGSVEVATDAANTALIEPGQAEFLRTGYSVLVFNNASDAMRVETGGGTPLMRVVSATGDITANSYADISDERLKMNIRDLGSQINGLMALRPVEFDFIASGVHGEGLIAQEVEKVYPDLVFELEDGTKAVRYSRLAIKILKAFQEIIKESR